MKKQYTVLEFNMKKVDELIKKLNKRASKCKAPEIKYTIDKEYFEDLNKDSNSTEEKIVKLFDITIDAEPIKIEGYSILASINHTYQTGNIVKTLSDKEIPEKYQDIEGICEHCNTKRMRKETVLLEDEKGNIIQVGKSCLKDYLGYSINDKLNYMDLLNEIENHEAFGATDFDSVKFAKYVKTEKLLQITNLLIKKFGYIKTRDFEGDININSTKAIAVKIYSYDNPNHWSEEEKEISDIVDRDNYNDEEVLKILAWIQEQDSKTDYINNLKVLSSNKYINYNEAGILCSLIACYNRAMETEEKVKKTKVEINNEYVGAVGDKIEIEATYKKRFTYDTDYGTMVIYLFSDSEGHEFKWTSKTWIEQKEGDTVQLRGTIKAHEEYKDTRQTVLTRCKVK